MPARNRWLAIGPLLLGLNESRQALLARTGHGEYPSPLTLCKAGIMVSADTQARDDE